MNNTQKAEEYAERILMEQQHSPLHSSELHTLLSDAVLYGIALGKEEMRHDYMKGFMDRDMMDLKLPINPSPKPE